MTALPSSSIPDEGTVGAPDAATGTLGRQIDEAAALHRAGELNEAEAAYRAILAKAPDHPDTLHLLGYLHHQMDRDGEAVTCFTRSIAANGKKPMVHANLGNVLLRQGDLVGAVGCFRTALNLDPGNRLFLSRLAEGFARGWFDPSDPKIPAELVACLAADAIDPRRLRRTVLAALDLAAKPPNLDDPLLAAFMGREVLADEALETWLVALRRGVLEGSESPPIEQIAALARQSELCDFVWPESAEESLRIEALAGVVEQALVAGEAPDAASVALLASYRLLDTLPCADALLAVCESLPGALSELVDDQITKRRATSTAVAAIESATPVSGGLSTAVRTQYEENPYPRWEHTGETEALPVATVMTRMFPRLADQDQPWPEAPHILIAGCGTGRHAIDTAQRFTDAAVLAFDLSRPSLGYGARKAEELGINNVRFVQGDLLALEGENAAYDIIESGGVLHHLEDTLTGWRILTGLLADGGLMKIGLYSEAARRHIVAARRFVAAGGYAPTPEDIRRCRQDILALPTDDIVRKVVASPDFYNLSSCRDLIFHVHEHHFTLPALAAMIDELGLEFLGFELTDPTVLAKYRAAFSDDPAALDLSNWAHFEADNPDVFAAMYQFWLRKPAGNPGRPALPSDAFRRVDEAADDEFYREARLVTHIDDAAIAAVTELYRERLPAGGAILDLMSSWVSHLPDDVLFGRVVGLGMNPEELAANPRLNAALCQDLNADPTLPFADGEFDAATLCVSIQYLTRPVDVLCELARVVKPGGPLIVTYSNRCFATKAVGVWLALNDAGHGELIEHCLTEATNWTAIERLERSPAPGKSDPLYAVVANSLGPTP
jgi:ubiquinone/menaquinone biosynthesis C-methylase UbiE/tetratricopeptide (TPR) repeat protein